MTTQNKQSIITLVTFFSFTVLFYFIGFWLIFRMGKATPLMLSVGAATIATCYVRKIKLASLGWQWGANFSQWQSYFIPLFIALTSYCLIWFFGFADWYNSEFVTTKQQAYRLDHWQPWLVIVFHILFTATISCFMALPSVLGEEIGWRGLLFVELNKIASFKVVALISGLIWAIWHYPLIFMGLYGNDGPPLAFQLLCFTVFITSSGVIMAYLRYKTNSIWSAVIYHMSSNIFIQKIFTPLSAQSEYSQWYIDEFGVMLALVSLLVASYFWRKGSIEFNRKY